MITKKILVVEDEKPLRDALISKLSKEGFEPLEAANGKEGLASAIAQHPDLILLDVIMPEMDGFTMIDKLRSYEKESSQTVKEQIPIILLTNLSDQEHLAESQKHGVYDYLIKTDWTLEAVITKIKNKLGIS